ncbi:MAG TPA: choice-of-anchor tandem repeat GloVer-containing protein [Candidatus Cybelea sp.]
MSHKNVTAFLCGVVLASCGQVTNPVPSSPHIAGAAASAAGYKLVYSFRGYPSGETPTGITSFRGALYGTTIDGGTHTFGTVFVRTATGVKTLYSFKGGSDGSGPTGALVPFGGKLYGTTEYGGPAGDGTVFNISATGHEQVVYSFNGGTDGAVPIMDALVAVNGALYGTTSAGGDSSCHVGQAVGCGVVFSVTPQRAEHVLHRFGSKAGDGAVPIGGLVESGGNFFGTTEFGGSYGNGTVYALTSSGSEHRLYNFKGYPDGANPFAGVTLYQGTFYGTTAFGGAFDYSGTVYSLDSSGTERVLHSFRGFPDGATPIASLSVFGGVLYGTTQYGGDDGHQCLGHGVEGCGVVFTITTSGNEKTLYRFKGVPDGANPWMSPILSGKRLYGTTVSAGRLRHGSIFALPAPGN